MYEKVATVTVALIYSLTLNNYAHAATNLLSRIVISGKAKRIAAYHSWDRTCNSLAATVNVVTGPSHGVLVPRVVSRTIKRGTRGSTQCFGQPIKALEILYKSRPGYRGADTFVIDVIYGAGFRDTNTYTVTIK